jgi:hypothetical protein
MVDGGTLMGSLGGRGLLSSDPGARPEHHLI